MKARLLRIAKFLAYPALYCLCLGLFFYLAFPWDRLKDRLVAEFQAAQKGKSAGQRIEIDELDSYWFTGVEATGVRLYLPPSDDASSSAAGPFGSGADKDKPAPKESVIEIDAVEARLQILPLFLGRVRVKFWARAFDGELNGTVPVGGSSGPMEVELEGVNLGKVDVIKDFLGVPVKGVAKGTFELTAEGGKFSKANGALDLTIAEMAVGDGKSKIKGQIALPEAKLGDLVIAAEAKEGVLKVTKLEANGSDLELAGDGKVNVREPWNNSTADLYVRFKFTDAYRNKSDLTKSLLGAPGSNAPSLFELADPKIKKSKRQDGFYGWHAHGALSRMRFDPHSTDGPAAGRGRGKGDSPFPSKKPGLPVGMSTAKEKGDEEPARAPATAEPKPVEPPREAPPPPEPADKPTPSEPMPSPAMPPEEMPPAPAPRRGQAEPE
ncbi:type II secretion system protein GspN [Polyangium jinanense]|uniref:Type II secretion system protein GspN n=1 Tax=Polyangium jinanense TaxID=2829994 RepID=A0A9X3WYM6_9BACT|nr:type II secretion system protein GspN [Polyangium jinanense]MDC3952916.1 type II secretion system protein GspN [Polyangium jinanense]MDC3980534.1 type II secretion system protein GspN [Polyangium jinanense]